MAYRWGEIQIESLKKMFLNNTSIYEKDLEEMKVDNKYKIYLNAMPQAANEAIYECMKRSRPYIKTFNFTQFPINNLLGDDFKTISHIDNEIEYIAPQALSYYFEVDNKSKISIYRNDGSWTLLQEIEYKPQTPGEYKAYKGFIDNPNKTDIRIVFSGDNPYHIRNVAMYKENYDYSNGKVQYIPDYKPYNIYNLDKLIKDFYKIDKLYFENESHELVHNNDYVMEDSRTMVINSELHGNFILKYQAYPEKLTLETSSQTVLRLEDEVAAILPLYIASQLYKDDDISISTVYRNEFEVALENLYPKYNDLKFKSKSGWL